VSGTPLTLYWRGKPVVTEQKVGLRGLELTLAVIVAGSALATALFQGIGLLV